MMEDAVCPLCQGHAVILSDCEVACGNCGTVEVRFFEGVARVEDLPNLASVFFDTKEGS